MAIHFLVQSLYLVLLLITIRDLDFITIRDVTFVVYVAS